MRYLWLGMLFHNHILEKAPGSCNSPLPGPLWKVNNPTKSLILEISYDIFIDINKLFLLINKNIVL